MKKEFGICLAFILLAGQLFSQNDRLTSSTSVDWEKGKLFFDIAAPIESGASPFPRARFEAEQRIEDERTALFFKALDNVELDSSATIAEFLKEPSATNDRYLYLEALNGAVSRPGKKTSLVSADFRTLSIHYEYDFFGKDGIASPLVRHPKPLPLPSLCGYETTRTCSGVVIYAQGVYTSFGKNLETPCSPALFPKIYYLSAAGTIETVLEMNMVKPEALKNWGMVEYTSTTDKSAFLPRVGSYPLEITAFAVYGNYNTDIVISEESAKMLLAKEENREFLRDGKILVIVDKPARK